MRTHAYAKRTHVRIVRMQVHTDNTHSVRIAITHVRMHDTQVRMHAYAP